MGSVAGREGEREMEGEGEPSQSAAAVGLMQQRV